MKDQKKIKKEIEAIGLRAKADTSGFFVYPGKKGIDTIYTSELNKLIAIAQEHRLRGYYINFAEGYVRLH